MPQINKVMSLIGSRDPVRASAKRGVYNHIERTVMSLTLF